ncbi:hypothetical protein [Xanthomarina sp. F2636L]|uniref:hypothetical protein n=1 Tax=Xanthomarina sp. F2636L TaxID=2996018 RepID=UPI00225E4C80|nr:hypothetical protein [Xanthomarina sp. F2636L]MCX7549518.1 hypothetical protein [Xanthomarina sp. F2636L]
MHEITVLSEYKSKSTVVYKTETKYYEKAEGNITVSFDKENKVIQMLAPKSVPIDLFARVSSIDDFKKCIEPCDQEFWCVVECALDHLF